jgi:hypothetical protein
VEVPLNPDTPRAGPGRLTPGVSVGKNDESGKLPEQLEWLSLNESRAMVKHWLDDLRAEKYGHLALLTPESGAIRDPPC